MVKDLTHKEFPWMKSDRDFIGLLRNPFYTNVGITCYRDQIGLFKLVICG